ncbi:MAG: Type 1 glutamine amidotransferase-like domain-containing protein [Nocardioidaceae bacterium]
MTGDRRQIFAFSGILEPAPGDRSGGDLVEYAVGLAGRPDDGLAVCYLPTAVGDSQAVIDGQSAWFAERRPEVAFSVLRLFDQPNVPDVRAHLLAQDVILVSGGSVVNLAALWRAHGLPAILHECWVAGVVLAGASAGSLCWHLGGPTDSYRDGLDPFTDGLGFLPYTNGVHDDFGDQPRRQAYRDMVAGGALSAGYTSEDGVGLHYVGTRLHEAVSIRPGARAWWVEADGQGGYAEKPITPRGI